MENHIARMKHCHPQILFLLDITCLSTLSQVVNENVVVRDSSGKEIQSQLLPILDASIGLRNYHTVAYLGVSSTVKPKYWLAFSATVPPLGFSTYYVSNAKQAGQSSSVIPFLRDAMTHTNTKQLRNYFLCNQLIIKFGFSKKICKCSYYFRQT